MTSRPTTPAVVLLAASVVIVLAVLAAALAGSGGAGTLGQLANGTQRPPPTAHPSPRPRHR
jgi:hypothetical protein